MRRQKTDYIVIHCSATPPSWDIGAAEIKHLHTASRSTPIPWGTYDLKGKGWSDIGYHLVLPRYGIPEMGRAFDQVGAHVKGYNRISFGLCMVGGVDENGKPEDNYTDAQWAVMDFLVDMLRSMYPGATLLGHRDLSPDLDGDGVVEPHEFTKACPSYSVKDRWK